jgi:hypothetical protein
MDGSILTVSTHSLTRRARSLAAGHDPVYSRQNSGYPSSQDSGKEGYPHPPSAPFHQQQQRQYSMQSGQSTPVGGGGGNNTNAGPYSKLREPYPAWANESIPLSKEEIEDVFIDLANKVGLRRRRRRRGPKVRVEVNRNEGWRFPNHGETRAYSGSTHRSPQCMQ